MVTHFFTLRSLAGELNDGLRGFAFDEVFSQQKNELILSVRAPDGKPRSLVISVEPRMNYCYVRDRVARARRNSVDLFPELIGQEVLGVGIEPFDRTLRLTVSGLSVLLMRLYDSAASNLYLIDNNRIVLRSFKRSKEFSGRPETDQAPRMDERILENAGAFSGSLPPGQPVLAALRRVVPVLGTLYAREVLHRAGVDETTPADALAGTELSRLFAETQKMIEPSTHDRCLAYFRDSRPEILSTVEMTHLPERPHEQFPGINDGIRFVISRTFSLRTADRGQQELTEAIGGELERVRKSLLAANAQAQSAGQPEALERAGKLLMANLGSVRPGAREVELPDILSHGEPISVKVNPALTPSANAAAYFEKARKARKAATELSGRLAGLKRRAELLEQLHEQIELAETRDDIEEFTRTHERLLGELGLSVPAGAPKAPQPPFRIFTVAGGYEVWVGKSSANNDLLTTRHARPDDLWFHARGASGSHTVLKVGSSGKKPPREAIRQAAAIAAWYSKMRKASNVPVAWCERKFVRKPKHAPEGTVVLEREEVIFVQPALPAGK